MPTFRFSGRTYPQLAQSVRELCTAAGRWCQPRLLLLLSPLLSAQSAEKVAGHDQTARLVREAYAEKLAAARAAERVYGVKAVANDLKVQLSRAPRDDSDIAKAIAHILEWNVQIP